VIKSIGLLTRKDGLTHEDFVKHWLEVHAPLAHAVPGVRRYVQSHIVAERTRPDIPTTDVEIDGIAELWYDDRAAMEPPMPRPKPSGSTPTARSSSVVSRASSSRGR
jgi:uncharacterized protein (TIGR02118 family)